MLKTFKFRIYPTKKQSRLLDSTLEQCRWLFNHLLAERKTAYKEHGENVTCFEQQATFAYLKEHNISFQVTTNLPRREGGTGT